jgi:hypothetical protein
LTDGRPRRLLLTGLATVLLAAGVAAVPTATASASPARPATGCDPAAFSATGAAPAADYDAAFTAYGDTGGAWSGADSTYSAPLPGDRELWAFSDTLIGPVNADGSRSPETPFVNNSFVVTRHGHFDTVIGGTPGDPESVVAPADPDAWYWSGDPVVGGRTLQIPYLQFHRTGSGVFDFAWQQNVVATFDARTLRPVQVTPLPSATGIEWGSYTERFGAWTYVYGVEDLGSDKYLHVARVAGTDLRGRWQFFTGTGWSAVEGDSARVLDGVSNEYSVTRLSTGYVLITQDTTELLGPHVVAYFSCSPTGPFTNKTPVYTTPETGATGSYGNPNVYTYNPHAHPELSSGNQLLISYNVNTFNIDDLWADASIYRPRFVVATFAGPGVPRAGSVDPIGRPHGPNHPDTLHQSTSKGEAQDETRTTASAAVRSGSGRAADRRLRF